jgi:hypothetical protein
MRAKTRRLDTWAMWWVVAFHFIFVHAVVARYSHQSCRSMLFVKAFWARRVVEATRTRTGRSGGTSCVILFKKFAPFVLHLFLYMAMTYSGAVSCAMHVLSRGRPEGRTNRCILNFRFVLKDLFLFYFTEKPVRYWLFVVLPLVRLPLRLPMSPRRSQASFWPLSTSVVYVTSNLCRFVRCCQCQSGVLRSASLVRRSMEPRT